MDRRPALLRSGASHHGGRCLCRAGSGRCLRRSTRRGGSGAGGCDGAPTGGDRDYAVEHKAGKSWREAPPADCCMVTPSQRPSALQSCAASMRVNSASNIAAIRARSAVVLVTSPFSGASERAFVICDRKVCRRALRSAASLRLSIPSSAPARDAATMRSRSSFGERETPSTICNTFNGWPDNDVWRLSLRFA